MQLNNESIRQSKILKYVIAVIFTIAFVVVRGFFQPLVGYHGPFLMAAFAVMASAWLGGFGPGIVATFLCTAFSIYFFIEPIHTSIVHTADEFRIIVFIVQGFAMSGIIAGLLRSRETAKLNEQSLSESENRFRTMANSIPQLAWMAEARGWVFWYNDRWYEFTGTTLSDVEGWGWKHIVHPDHIERVMKGYQRSLLSGEPWEDTFPIRSKDGEWRWFLTRARPIYDNKSDVAKWFGTNTDITENLIAEEELKKARDAAEAANRSKTQFLANMSHEIRTPMNAILGFSELLSDKDLDEDLRAEHLHRIRLNGEHLLSLIDDILDLSKVEAGQMTTEKQWFNLTELIDETVAGVSVLAHKKNLEILLDYDDNVPESVNADPVRLRQVFTNLLSNAVKFTEVGQIKIRVRCLAENAIRRLRLSVEDTGIGISEDAQAAIFRPFSQADSSVTRKYGGTGLGLSLSRRIAQVMGGSLTLAWSRAHEGSCFTFEIPVNDISQEFVHKEKTPLKFSSPENSTVDRDLRGHGAQILLAEDSPDLEALMRFYVEREGYHVDSAHNGEEAIALAKAHDYDVVLMDVQMPLLDGLEATRRLRKLGYKKPIVALTAHALRDDVRKSLDAGCDAHLSKPVDRKDLLLALRRFAHPKTAAARPSPPQQPNL